MKIASIILCAVFLVGCSLFADKSIIVKKDGKVLIAVENLDKGEMLFEHSEGKDLESVKVQIKKETKTDLNPITAIGRLISWVTNAVVGKTEMTVAAD